MTSTDCKNPPAVVFVVDSSDIDRILFAYEELYYTTLESDKLNASLLLVFANKQDSPRALETSELADRIGLHGLTIKWHTTQVGSKPLLFFVKR